MIQFTCKNTSRKERGIYLDTDSLGTTIDRDVRIKTRNGVNSTLIRDRVRGSIAVPERKNSAVERIIGRRTKHCLGEPKSLAHQREIMRSQAAQEAAQPALFVGNLLPGESFVEQSLKATVTLLICTWREIGALDLERAALVDKLSVGTAEVANAGIEDLGDGRDLPLESIHVAGGITAHVTNECLGRALVLGSKDPVRRRDGEGHGLLDEHMLVGLERSNCKSFMAVVGGEDEDDIHLGMVDDLLRLRGLVGDVKLCCTVIQLRLRDITDGLDFVLVREKKKTRPMTDLEYFLWHNKLVRCGLTGG